ncbi:O-antigen polymerase [Nitrolancea hollandica Lb]|uniref:O-antigen polymerase n=2 Tax=Nitrolancea hollandica TaxID=1206749 RepID=I4EFU8_9BACT|nr:O-antigen polymerase [Nitrolancea hollandica Lb]
MMRTEARLPGNIRRAQAATIAGLVGIAILIGAAYIAPNLPFLLALGLGITAIAALHPPSALAAIPASIGLVFHPIRYSGLEFSPAEILILATTAGVTLRVIILFLLRTESRPGITPRELVHATGSGFGPAALLMLVAGVVSLVTLADPAHRHESLRTFRWVIVEPILYAVLARYYLRDSLDRWITGAAFVGAATAISVYGLVLLLDGGGLSVEGVRRISGTYPHPNALALYLEQPIAFGFALAMTARRKIVSLLWLAMTSICGIALVMTFSRGALLGTALAVVAIATLSQRQRLARRLIPVLVILGLVLTIVAGPRMLSLFGGGSGSLRVAIWESAIAMIRDHPIFGVGLDQFLYQYAPRYIAPEAWPERFTAHPHDIFLDVWLSLGILGIAAAGVYAITLTRTMRHIVRRVCPLGLAAAGAIIAGVVHGLIDNGYFVPDLALMFWFLTAIIELEGMAATRDTDQLGAMGEEVRADTGGWRSGVYRLASLRRAR